MHLYNLCIKSNNILTSPTASERDVTSSFLLRWTFWMANIFGDSSLRNWSNGQKIR